VTSGFPGDGLVFWVAGGVREFRCRFPRAGFSLLSFPFSLAARALDSPLACRGRLRVFRVRGAAASRRGGGRALLQVMNDAVTWVDVQWSGPRGRQKTGAVEDFLVACDQQALSLRRMASVLAAVSALRVSSRLSPALPHFGWSVITFPASWDDQPRGPP